MPLKLTAVAPAKPLPSIVTAVPTGPRPGLEAVDRRRRDEDVGGARVLQTADLAIGRAQQGGHPGEVHRVADSVTAAEPFVSLFC